MTDDTVTLMWLCRSDWFPRISGWSRWTWWTRSYWSCWSSRYARISGCCRSNWFSGRSRITGT